MAKHRHRVFEIYDFHDEAVRALTPKTDSLAKVAIDTESWEFNVLAASLSAYVLHVTFKTPRPEGVDEVNGLRKDFTHLTEKLDIGSKVLLDFSGQNLFSTDSIDTLVAFNKNLRHNGSRLVLCCLDPMVRNSFFPAR